MYGKKNLIFAIVWFVIGITLIVLSALNVLQDFWTASGAAFAAIGLAQLVRYRKYKTDEKFRQKTDLAYSDERYKYVKGRAFAYTGYISIFGMCIASFVCFILKKTEISAVLAFAACAELVIYWISFMIIERKN